MNNISQGDSDCVATDMVGIHIVHLTCSGLGSENNLNYYLACNFCCTAFFFCHICVYPCVYTEPSLHIQIRFLAS